MYVKCVCMFVLMYVCQVCLHVSIDVRMCVKYVCMLVLMYVYQVCLDGCIGSGP